MPAPFVGLPTTRESRSCAYADDLDQPPCHRVATKHLIVQSDAWGIVGLATCDGHESIARAAGRVIDGHPPSDDCADGTCIWRSTRTAREAHVRIPATALRRFHAWATVGWAILAIPTVMWWSDSILWVALLSVWANVASHFACWQASRAEDAAGGGS